MAERRMFAKTIVLSDAFLDMPMSARCLYFTLGMVADDDGFVNAPRAVMKQIGASDDDAKVLLSKKFIIPCDDGVVVIKHWRVNNYLQKDRYKETIYKDHKDELCLDEKGIYHLKDTQRTDDETMYTQSVYTQDRLGKDSIGKYNPPIIPPLGGVDVDKVSEPINGYAVEVKSYPTLPTDPFDDFWEAYPKKQGKEAARKAFDKAAKNVSLDTLLNALATQKVSEQWKRNKGQYIPMPATWLNQGRWQDEIDAEPETARESIPLPKSVRK